MAQRHGGRGRGQKLAQIGPTAWHRIRSFWQQMSVSAPDKSAERRGGHNRKSVEQHLLDGTYREDRHGPLVQPTELAYRPAPTPRAQCGRPEKWSKSAADEYAIREGCWFDERRAEYVVKWFRDHLQLSDSEWAGQPFELQAWQRDEIIYPLFGWHRTDEKGREVRRFNMTYIEIPKKNGKSTLASGIGLHLLCGEGNKGNEVYSAATDKDQASIVHEAVGIPEGELHDAAHLQPRRARDVQGDRVTAGWLRRAQGELLHHRRIARLARGRAVERAALHGRELAGAVDLRDHDGR
jgi:hypothetical protein